MPLIVSIPTSATTKMDNNNDRDNNNDDDDDGNTNKQQQQPGPSYDEMVRVVDDEEVEEEEEDDDLPAKFSKNIFLPPIGTPSTNSPEQQPQQHTIPTTTNDCNFLPTISASSPSMGFPSSASGQPMPEAPTSYTSTTSIAAAAQALLQLQAAQFWAGIVPPNRTTPSTTIFNNMMLMNKHSNGNQQQPQTQLATPENFLLFIQLAQIFGFQVDFAQKKAILHVLPPPPEPSLSPPNPNPLTGIPLHSFPFFQNGQQQQQQQCSSPVELLLFAASSSQQQQHVQQRQNTENGNCNNHNNNNNKGMKRKGSSSSTGQHNHHYQQQQQHLSVPSNNGSQSRRSPASISTSTSKVVAGGGSSSQQPIGSTSPYCANAEVTNTNDDLLPLNTYGQYKTELHSPASRSHVRAPQLSPLLAHLPPIQHLNQTAMREYLANPACFEYAIWIFHAKVAQKSYGNEKRFFCPPPCLYLLGDGWRTKSKALERIFRQFKDQKSQQLHNTQGKHKRNSASENDQFPLNGDVSFELFSELNATIGINPAETGGEKLTLQQTAHQLDFSNGKDYCAAKALYISDSDKRKYFHLQARFTYAEGAIDMGNFISQKIKVISKPSKKKQSMKSSDCKYLCVSNGSKIALFNRLRSQTVSTRYLHVENGSFHASSTKWGAFHINAVDSQFSPIGSELAGHQQFQRQNPTTIITYGSIIQLVDSQSDIALPRLRIRKVDKQMVLLDPAGQGEPVSQLHKCAFQMVDNTMGAIAGQELMYLCLSHDRIIQHQAIRIDAYRHQISDGASWTIISTDKTEYRWAEPMLSVGGFARQPVTPMPQLHNWNAIDENGKKIGMSTGGGAEMATLALNGVNFSSTLRVWFGATPSPDTQFHSAERLTCLVPPPTVIFADYRFGDGGNIHGTNGALASLAAAAATTGKLEVPILLCRDEDGVVFPTHVNFPVSLNECLSTTAPQAFLASQNFVADEIKHETTENGTNNLMLLSTQAPDNNNVGGTTTHNGNNRMALSTSVMKGANVLASNNRFHPYGSVNNICVIAGTGGGNNANNSSNMPPH